MFHEPGVFSEQLGSIFAKKIVPFGSVGARVCSQSPTVPLYYEGKVMKTTFPKNYVYVLRTTKTRHMVSFIDLSIFQQIFRPKSRLKCSL